MKIMHPGVATPLGVKRRSYRDLALACILSFTLLFGPQPLAAQSNVPSGSPLANSQPSQNEDPRDSENRDNSSSSNNAYDPYQPVDINAGNKSDRTSDKESQADQLLSAEGKDLVKPAKPGEFERYVETAMGRKVPRFGANLLTQAQRDFAVPAQATIPPDYPINVGDTVSVSLSGSIEGSADFVVDTNGRINIPKVGTVTLAGVRYRDLRDRISQAIGRQYRGYEVSVSIKKLRGLRVYVTGFANNPGAYSLNSLSTMVNAVLAAGGPNAGGSFRSVQLIRNGQVVADYDLYDLIRSGDRSRDPILHNEDVLFIPPVGAQAAVIGSVNEEAIYELKPGETLADAMRYAGGANVLGDASRLILYRLSDKQALGSRQIAIAEAKGFTAEPGDIIQVLSQGSLVQPLERQQVVVRLEGEVNRPGNYYVAPNTPLSQVIELAGGLTPRAYVYGTKLTRSSVAAQQRISFKDAIDQFEMALTTAPLTAGALGAGANRAEQLQAGRQILAKLRNAEPDGRLVLPIPYGAAALPGDLLLENNDQIIIPPVIATVGVFGSVYRPASFLLDQAKPPRVRDIVEKAGGVQRAGDRGSIFLVRANGEVVTRRRGAMGARLQPGDIVFVPVKTQSTSLLEKISAVTQIIYQLGLGAAAVAALK